MPVLRMEDFKGRIPRLIPRLLPVNFAQIANNTRLEDGGIGPLRNAASTTTLATASRSFLRHNGAWLSWDSVVDAVPGPVATDRLYIAGPGFAPEMRVSGTTYALKLPAPDTAPALDVEPSPEDGGDGAPGGDVDENPPTSGTTTNIEYAYSYLDGEGRESELSPRSNTIAWEDGEIVRARSFATPPAGFDIRTIRLYRANAGSTLYAVAEFAVSRWGYDHNLAAEPLGSSHFVSTPTIQNFPSMSATISGSYSVFNNSGHIAGIPDPVGKRFSFYLNTDGRYVTGTVEQISYKGPRVRLFVVPNTIEFDQQSVDMKDVVLPAPTSAPVIGVIQPDTGGGGGGGGTGDTGSDATDSPNLEPLTNPADEETIVYAYTFVTGFGEESAPSYPSAPTSWSPGRKVTLSGLADPPASRDVTHYRIYRSQTARTGVTDLYFVAQIPVAETTYEHDLDQAPMQEPIQTRDYKTPPDGLAGIIPMPNGMMAGWEAKNLHFCEPYRPHAWPAKYSLTVNHDIVGLAAFGSTVAVLTTGEPYIAQGTRPDNMTIERVEQSLPCLSRTGIVDLGYSAAYPSSDGLVLVSQSNAQVITRDLFTREQWQAMHPETFIAGRYNGRYVFSYTDDGGATRKLGIIDLSGQQPFFMTADFEACAFWYDIAAGELYFIEGADTGTAVRQWDTDTSDHLTQKWRSRVHHLRSPINFGAILIEAEAQTPEAPLGLALEPGQTFTAKVFADGNEIAEITTVNTAARLPGGFLAYRWEVEIETNLSITSISLAGAPHELPAS